MEKAFNPWKHIDNFSSVRFDDKSNELEQWPIKLWQVPAVTPFFHGAHLLVAADCSAFAYPSFHDSLSRGKIPVICCPAQDYDIVSKLSDILALNDIKSITVAKMEAECCADLEAWCGKRQSSAVCPFPSRFPTYLSQRKL